MLTLGFVMDTLMDEPARSADVALSSVVIDSRESMPGSLFVALAGEREDGHNYVADAFARGAVAALVERPVAAGALTIDARDASTAAALGDGALPLPICLVVEDALAALQRLAAAWRGRFPALRVVGITGSVGKTSTKELAHAVLAQEFETLKSEGNYNNEIGLPLSLLRLGPEHERAVLEMGMYEAGEIRLLCELARPHVGVVTMIGAVHMEWLGSLEAIARAKRELVEALPADGTAILNRDDPLVMEMAAHTPAQVFTYGLDEQADLWADEITSRGLDGVRFRAHYGGDTWVIQVPLLGRHSVHTALRAIAVGLVEGLSWNAIISGLQNLGPQLRLVAVPGPKDSIILDDTYNSSPESAVAALNLLEELSGRHVAVLGDMLELGPVEEASHRLVGRRAKEVTDVLVAVGRRGQIIGEEAIAAGMAAENVHFAADADASVAILENVIATADVILVKGSRGVRLDRVVSALGEG